MFTSIKVADSVDWPQGISSAALAVHSDMIDIKLACVYMSCAALKGHHTRSFSKIKVWIGKQKFFF